MVEDGAAEDWECPVLLPSGRDKRIAYTIMDL